MVNFWSYRNEFGHENFTKFMLQSLWCLNTFLKIHYTKASFSNSLDDLKIGLVINFGQLLILRKVTDKVELLKLLIVIVTHLDGVPPLVVMAFTSESSSSSFL